MTQKNKWFSLILCLGLLLPALVARAEDDEESKAVKAADAIIASLPAGFKVGVELGKMTPAQRIDFVVTGIESKIQDEVAAGAQDAILEKMKVATEKAIRSKVFTEKIRLAYVPGQVLNWADFDKELSDEVEKRMNTLGAAVTVAKVGWGAYQAFSEGDWPAALKSVGGEISGRLAEAFVPGFGYIKIGAEMVEVLGRFVLDYATDTAIDGLLERIFHKRSNPQELSQWLRNKSPQEIKDEINLAFREGAEAGLVYEGKGTVTGEATIKIRLLDTLVALRGELLAREKQQDPLGQRLKEEADKRRQDFLYAQRMVEKAAEAAVNKANEALAPIRDFKRRVNKMRKEDVQQVIAAIETRKDAVDEGGEVPYVALNRGALIGELRNFYSEVKDTTGSGLDLAAMDRMWSAYVQRKDQEINAWRQANQESYDRTQKPIVDAHAAENKAIEEKYEVAQKYLQSLIRLSIAAASSDVRARAQAEVDRIGAEMVRLNAVFQARWNKVYLSWRKNQQAMALEVAAFAQEEQVVELEAQERADKLSEQIEAAMKQISEGIRAAQRQRDAAINAWHQEIEATLSLPQLFTSTIDNNYSVYSPYYEICVGNCICGAAEAIRKGQMEWPAPGSLHPCRDVALINLKKITEDATRINALSDKEKAIISSYQTTIQSLSNLFESLLPKNLRAVSTDDPSGGELSQSEAIAKYGTGRGFGESWRVVLSDGGTLRLNVKQFASLDIKTYSTPSVGVPVRFHRQQLQELEAAKSQRIKNFEGGRKNIQQMISVMDFYADLDRIAVSIMSMGANLEPVLSPYIGMRFNFQAKDGKTDPLVLASYSDGGKGLVQMKEAWEKYKPFVERMRNNVKAYGKGLKYGNQVLDRAIAALAKYEAIPDQIAAADKQMAATEAERLVSIAQIEKELKQLKGDFQTLQNPNERMNFPIRLRNLRLQLENVFNYMDPDTVRGAMRRSIKHEYVKLRDEIEKYVKEYEANSKKSLQEYQRAQEAQKASEATEREATAAREQSQRDAGDAAVRKLYQDFASTYQTRNLSGLLRYMAEDWKASDGSDLRDLEDVLGNSFRVFDRIQFAISGLSIRAVGQGHYSVSYTATITGHINQMNLKHQESAQVEDSVVLTPDGPKIQATRGGRLWLQQ